MSKFKMRKDINYQFDTNIDTMPMWPIIVRGVLSFVAIVLFILGGIGVIDFAIAISISLILLGTICICTAFPMFKFGKKSPAIATIISGTIVIFCGIKTILGF